MKVAEKETLTAAWNPGDNSHALKLDGELEAAGSLLEAAVSVQSVWRRPAAERMEGKTEKT